MYITKAAADKIKVDPMDAYHYMGLKSCNQGNQCLEVFSGFLFLIEEGLQFIEGENSNHILNESIDTDTHACGV